MYLHLGQEIVVRSDEIIGIFDIDNTSIGKATRNFLSTAEKKHSVINVALDIPKSFIVCEYNGKTTVYISQISPSTLKKRANIKNTIDNIIDE
ncbi:MAG: DUF370 domain-containing protein [Oscillospiraceae bacterium]